MRAEITIIIFFLCVGLISAGFHWYFVGDHRLKLIEEPPTYQDQGIILKSGKNYIIFDDVRIYEILPNGTKKEVIFEESGSNDWCECSIPGVECIVADKGEWSEEPK